MPFARPGVTTLRDQAQNDMVTQLGVPTLLRRSPLRAIGYAQAGLAYHQYGYLDYIAQQSNPFTATLEYLEGWAALVGILRIPATQAVLNVAVVGPPGAVIPAATPFRRSDGATFSSGPALVIPPSGILTVSVTADVPGAAGQTPVGAQLALAQAILGVQQMASVLAVTAIGADQEYDAPFRTRMLEEYRSPPQGGSQSDYVGWAKQQPGVTRAWANPRGAGIGSVIVYVMLDRTNAAFGGFPQGTNGVAAKESRGTVATGDQLIIANGLYELRPVTAVVNVVCPLGAPVTFSILTPYLVSATVQAAVGVALDAVFLRLASPLGVPLPISAFETAIAAVPGMPSFTLAAPAAPITPPIGQLPERGTITYA